jgi:hypothetical protein
MTYEELQKKLKKNHPENLIKDLKAFQAGKKKSPLKPESLELGLILANALPALAEDGEEGYDWVSFTKDGKRLNRINEIIHAQDIWDNHQDLWVFLFGEEIAPLLKETSTILTQVPYQEDYYRRSFRAPNLKDAIFLRQISFVLTLVREFNYDISLAEYITHSHDIGGHYGQRYYIFAGAIQAGRHDIYELLLDITYNRHSTARVSRETIKAMLLCNKPEAWEAVEKLLLAAQRQEGLRQTILEALDECNVEAMKRMIKLVLDEKLTRFSSVVRALDVWVGLGWESQRESTIIRFMELAYKFLTEPNQISKAILSKDNAEIIMALWAQGVQDIELTYPLLDQIIATNDTEKTLLALYFVDQIGLPAIGNRYAKACLLHKDLAVVGKATDLLDVSIQNEAEKLAIFRTLEGRVGAFPEKETMLEGTVFSWLNFSINKQEIFDKMLCLLDFTQDAQAELGLKYYDELNSDNKWTIVGNILPDQEALEKGTKPTHSQRDFALKALKERASYIRDRAILVLRYAEVSEQEVGVFLDMLSRKSSDTRKSVIDILLKLKPELLQKSIEKLLKSNTEQRLAGLDMLTETKKLQILPADYIMQTVENFANNPKISEQERVLTDKLLDTTTDVLAYTAENGFGLFNPQNIVLAPSPASPTQGEYVEKTKNNPFGLSQTPEAINKALVALEKIILKHKEYEYEVENWSGTKETTLLGTGFRQIQYTTEGFTDLQIYENHPLPEVWAQWAIDHKITPCDLFLLNLFAQQRYQEVEQDEEIEAEFEEADEEEQNSEEASEGVDYNKWLQKIRDLVKPFVFVPKIPTKTSEYYWNNLVIGVLSILPHKFPYAQKTEFLEGFMQTLYAQLPEDEWQNMLESKNSWGGTYQYTWRKNLSINAVNTAYHTVVWQGHLTDERFTQFWHLEKWSFQNLPAQFQEKKDHTLDLSYYARAYTLGLVGKDEMIWRIMQPDGIMQLSKSKFRENEIDIKQHYPFLRELFVPCLQRILEIELKRGDSSTPVTRLAQSISEFYGANYFVQLLVGLGKSNLHRGYIYSWNNTEYNKTEILSTLLKHCLPAPTDTQQDFNERMQNAKITEKRAVEAATYAPQWIRFVSEYLGWADMAMAVWWLHAHTNAYHSAETETEIAKYSKVAMEDFRDGAVDTSWFQQVYASLGAERWKLLYESAKYISEGNGHTRAKLYADAILGNITLEEVGKRVTEKRNQDYLRVYGLLALDKKDADKDLLKRYQFLQKFKKESKQFGSQKQASEALAIRISMENLARNAGYNDPMRLTWAMEIEEALDILEKAKAFTFKNITINLAIDEDGKSELICLKDGKEIKTLPADLKKEADYLELKEFNATLQDQYKRTRKSLESAMIAGDAFTKKEMETLMRHPVVAPMLLKLVLESGGKLGFWQAGKLVSPSGEAALPTESIRIAHCTDLFAGKEWSAYQRHCFENGIKQPFKQIFRELYVPTEDELKERAISRRYAGHQVQPKKTVALLKSQGWTVDYDEGLQKVFHKEGFIAKIYAMADWFTPSDVESPTLETVEFISRTTGNNVPFEEISPRIFSEVMRDVDLVVSVAHVGEVDPEASQSSIELRTALVFETLRLFKITNVTLKGNHALIKGTKGEYSVHLGSAIAHKVASATLFILPVHSQHRGRMFLPFLDDDPRTAEIISKIILLAKDNEIQDPTILSQL